MGGGSSAGPRSVDPDAAATGTGTAVFITNLPFTTRWQDLKDIFRPHNLVATHADVIVDSAGRSKGLGTIRFNTQEDAERAVQIASGLQIGGRLISARLDRFL
jgi:RNA recognition motif-containing protein